MVSDRTFIFHMCIPCDKTFLLVPSSRSSVKVKYQGYSFLKKKMAVAGGLVFHIHSLLIYCTSSYKLLTSFFFDPLPTKKI